MVSYDLKKGDVIKEGNVLRLLPAGATTASATAHIGINEFINSKKKFYSKFRASGDLKSSLTGPK